SPGRRASSSAPSRSRSTSPHARSARGRPDLEAAAAAVRRQVAHAGCSGDRTAFGALRDDRGLARSEREIDALDRQDERPGEHDVEDVTLRVHVLARPLARRPDEHRRIQVVALGAPDRPARHRWSDARSRCVTRRLRVAAPYLPSAATVTRYDPGRSRSGAANRPSASICGRATTRHPAPTRRVTVTGARTTGSTVPDSSCEPAAATTSCGATVTETTGPVTSPACRR